MSPIASANTSAPASAEASAPIVLLFCCELFVVLVAAFCKLPWIVLRRVAMLWQPEIEQASWLQESSSSGYGFLGAKVVQQLSADRWEGKM